MGKKKELKKLKKLEKQRLKDMQRIEDSLSPARLRTLKVPLELMQVGATDKQIYAFTSGMLEMNSVLHDHCKVLEMEMPSKLLSALIDGIEALQVIAEEAEESIIKGCKK